MCIRDSPADGAAAGDRVGRWLISLAVGETDAATYQKALHAAGHTTPEAVQAASLTADALSALG
eukprot:4256214-Prymnesium_polylepis.1